MYTEEERHGGGAPSETVSKRQTLRKCKYEKQNVGAGGLRKTETQRDEAPQVLRQYKPQSTPQEIGTRRERPRDPKREGERKRRREGRLTHVEIKGEKILGAGNISLCY